MNIAITKRKRKDRQESLLLDYYLPKANQKRKKEPLNLFIYSTPKYSEERAHNKKILLLAESIRSKMFLELQHEFSNSTKENLLKDFITYFTEQTEKSYNNSSGNYGN